MRILSSLLVGFCLMGCGSSSNDGPSVITPVATTSVSTSVSTTSSSSSSSSSSSTSSASSYNLTFTAVAGNAPNAILDLLTTSGSPTNDGQLIPDAATALGFSGKITVQPRSPETRQRFLDIRFGVSNLTPIQVGDTFPAASASSGTTPRSQITYGEQNLSTPEVFLYEAVSGSVRLDALTRGAGRTGRASFRFDRVVMTPTSQSGNRATGSLEINGTTDLVF